MALLSVRVTPRSAKPGVGEWKSDPSGRDYLELRVAAAPTDGAANEEVIRLLAKALGLPRSRLSIASGESARLKRIDTPLSEIELRDRL
ncbi:DUF167 domain-containing protein [Sphingomonas jaspsi]|uniref:DUF167 domain-containing protein n=1 Tax=Sphingomonas jaspsi TaxID=392409 RepID=UPI0004BB5EAB|nr:DUF167 domain-containing protein [Sphingomonas jaspsi]